MTFRSFLLLMVTQKSEAFEWLKQQRMQRRQERMKQEAIEAKQQENVDQWKQHENSDQWKQRANGDQRKQRENSEQGKQREIYTGMQRKDCCGQEDIRTDCCTGENKQSVGVGQKSHLRQNFQNKDKAIKDGLIVMVVILVIIPCTLYFIVDLTLLELPLWELENDKSLRCLPGIGTIIPSVCIVCMYTRLQKMWLGPCEGLRWIFMQIHIEVLWFLLFLHGFSMGCAIRYIINLDCQAVSCEEWSKFYLKLAFCCDLPYKDGVAVEWYINWARGFTWYCFWSSVIDGILIYKMSILWPDPCW